MLPYALPAQLTPPTADTRPAPAPKERSFLVQPSLGIGAAAPSPQKDLYAIEGYSVGPDYVLSLGAVGFVSPRVGLGGSYGYTPSDTSRAGGLGRALHRDAHTFSALFVLPLGDPGDPFLLLSAKAGLTLGRASVEGSPRTQYAPYGAVAADLMVIRQLSLGIYFSRAPAKKPGAEGAADDYGSMGVQIGGIIDG